MGASHSTKPDAIVDWPGSGKFVSARVDGSKWRPIRFNVRLTPDASNVDPIRLWVDQTSWNGIQGTLFRREIRAIGFAPLLARWKELRASSTTIAVWARVQFLGKRWAGYRNTLGEICRALRTLRGWAISWQFQDHMFPPCTSCGTPGCFCDYCEDFERGFGDNALCTSCDSGNKMCILCFRNIKGSRCRF
jgi:hypothetical protein